ncbi:MAG TPA: response regulator transcription factor [Candidatus Sulfotelmatobacter sp.]|nr:response regulator transcription factor [Candidatus Sulfotelmatobacter sp.]
MSAIRIMVVDDFKQWRTTLRSVVEAVEGFRVVAEAGDALEAIAKAGRLRPDIVLLDIGLPLLNGIEAAPRIRRTSPGSKIIFLTQEHDSDVMAAAFAAGAEAYLLKSEVVGELRRVLDAVRQAPSRHLLRKHLETPHSDPQRDFQNFV